MDKCSHLDKIKSVPPEANACLECEKEGDSWNELRACLTCGHVGCCDRSKNQHARKHFENTQHPIVQAYGPDKRWAWCFVDEVYIQEHELPMEAIREGSHQSKTDHAYEVRRRIG